MSNCRLSEVDKAIRFGKRMDLVGDILSITFFFGLIAFVTVFMPTVIILAITGVIK